MSIDITQSGNDTSFAASAYPLTDVADAAKQTVEQTAEQAEHLAEQAVDQTQDAIEQGLEQTEFFADITASSSAFQQTLTTVTQSWITAMLDTFNQTNAMIWAMVNWTGAPLPGLNADEASASSSSLSQDERDESDEGNESEEEGASQDAESSNQEQLLH